MITIKIESVVERKWETQALTTPLDYLKANPNLDPIHRAQVARIAPGEVLHLNLGSGGVLRITRELCRALGRD